MAQGEGDWKNSQTIDPSRPSVTGSSNELSPKNRMKQSRVLTRSILSMYNTKKKLHLLTTTEIDDHFLLRCTFAQKTSHCMLNGLHPKPVPAIDQRRAALEFCDEESKIFLLGLNLSVHSKCRTACSWRMSHIVAWMVSWSQPRRHSAKNKILCVGHWRIQVAFFYEWYNKRKLGEPGGRQQD